MMIEIIKHVLGLCGETHVSVSFFSVDNIYLIWDFLNQQRRHFIDK
jgi:hypothetical protein